MREVRERERGKGVPLGRGVLQLQVEPFRYLDLYQFVPHFLIHGRGGIPWVFVRLVGSVRGCVTNFFKHIVSPGVSI